MLVTKLQPHQDEALAYIKDDHDPCLLAMFKGSGKSLVALAYAESLQAKIILITADKNNILNTWQDQVFQHTDYEVLMLPKGKALRMFIGINIPAKPTCILVNYDWLNNHWRDYADIHFDLWIADEIANLKDQRTQRFKSTRKLTCLIPHKVGLSGEVMTERLTDVYGQITILDGGIHFGSFTRFLNRYMYADPNGYDWIPKRSAFTILQRDIKDMSYWLKETPSIVMPRSVYHVVEVDKTKVQRRMDDELQRTFAASFEGASLETNYAPVVYQKRLQICGGTLHAKDESDAPISILTIPTEKGRVLAQIIKGNPKSRIVVWHTYILETKLLALRLSGLDVKVFIFDDVEKLSVLEAFSRSRPPSILLIRTSMCSGLNQLADADIAVFYSNPLSYQRRSQAEGRTRRLDTKNPVTHYVDIVTKGGADQHVYHALKQKKSFSMTLTNLRQFCK